MGIGLNADNFNVNVYLYMVLGGLMELPAYTILAPFVAKFGRIQPMNVLYLFCGVVVFALAFIPAGIYNVIRRSLSWCNYWNLIEYKILILVLANMGRFANASSLQITSLMVTELFPTDVRVQAQGFLSFSATLSFVAPYISDLLVNDFNMSCVQIVSIHFF